jgi:hypothetical protein
MCLGIGSGLYDPGPTVTSGSLVYVIGISLNLSVLDTNPLPKPYTFGVLDVPVMTDASAVEHE